jgi:hypothetical protein
VVTLKYLSVVNNLKFVLMLQTTMPGVSQIASCERVNIVQKSLPSAGMTIICKKENRYTASGRITGRLSIHSVQDLKKEIAPIGTISSSDRWQ